MEAVLAGAEVSAAAPEVAAVAVMVGAAVAPVGAAAVTNCRTLHGWGAFPEDRGVPTLFIRFARFMARASGRFFETAFFC